jgi:hypothetical protein
MLWLYKWRGLIEFNPETGNHTAFRHHLNDREHQRDFTTKSVCQFKHYLIGTKDAGLIHLTGRPENSFSILMMTTIRAGQH